MSKVIVLASGGVDSSLVMAKLLREGHEVYPLYSNYNQYAYENEAKSVRMVVDWLRRNTLMWGKPNTMYYLEPVTEVHINTGIGTIAACPGRVLSFVGAACIWAFTKGWTEGKIAIGIHKGDKDQDSCRVGYEDSLNETVKSLTQGCMEIITPLMGMTREEMAQEVAEIGIPWEILYNCYWGVPCGWQSKNMDYLCPGCRRKLEAMVYVKSPLVSRIVATVEGKGGKFAGPNCFIMDTMVTRRDWKRLT